MVRKSVKSTISCLYKGNQKKPWVLFYKDGKEWVGIDISTMRPDPCTRLKCETFCDTKISYNGKSIRCISINNQKYCIRK